MTENDLLITIKAAKALNATGAILDNLTQLAAVYIERGETQEGADVLAYILSCENIPDDILDHAQAQWDDLARYICPRVLLDATDFGKKATLDDVLDYVFAGV
jgi:hypothetical protein